MCRKNQPIQIFFLVFVLLFSLNFTQNEHTAIDNVTSIINDVETKYCPDRRTSLFNITANIKNDTLILQGQTLSIDAKNELLQKLEDLHNFKIEDNVIVLPHPELDDKTYGIIRLSVAQLRRSPGVESEIISQAIMGSEIRILKNNDITDERWWCYCQMDDDYLGWMMKGSLIKGDSEFINNWRENKKLVVISNYAQVFEKPSEKSRSVSDLVRGNKLIKIKKHRKWYAVELPDGRKGYVKANNVQEEEMYLNRSKAKPEDIVHTAFSFIGHPYLWGGTSAKGFDCSGFTQSMFKFNGIKLPRDANMQVNVGEEVSLDDNLKHLKPADLLFWGPTEENITHVGIYIGNNRYIHSDGMVRINSFNPNDEDYSGYRDRTLKRAKRIL